MVKKITIYSAAVFNNTTDRKMFGLVQIKGQQIPVKVGDRIRVERLTVPLGTTIEVDDVLMVTGEGKTLIGTPMISDAKVMGQVVAHDRDNKVIVFKKKRRKNYRRKKGHRQHKTVVRITSITMPEHLIS